MAMMAGAEISDTQPGLDSIFSALSDPTRRDILRRIRRYQLTITQIWEPYTNLTFAAVSKHLKVLEKAGFIIKRKIGRKQYVSLNPVAFKDAEGYLNYYTQFWESNLDSLKNYLEGGQDG
ncbi:MAG TPA: metalloregulator ArsR/SmtB family transcription factor [Candidatus Saccharimonadales bacterium]|nr:metalloregulator ArsR/SmtB family transcription factor [Candidatus Saccharimonadales bacterium]HSX27490.1 metalloregulator ArsR/SmtB family transcription factor [Patescibacteria group bacterium]